MAARARTVASNTASRQNARRAQMSRVRSRNPRQLGRLRPARSR